MQLTQEEQRQCKELIPPLLDQLYRLACYLCHDENDAEDLVAESVRKACENFHLLKDPVKIKPWLIRILRNTFISFCRERKKYMNIEYNEENSNEDEHFSLFTEVSQPFLLWWGNPERELLDKLLEEDIRQAISDLPYDFRFVVVLCDVNGFSYDEIANALDIPVGTVRSRLARGRSMLQKKLYHHAVERGIINKRRKRNEQTRIQGYQL